MGSFVSLSKIFPFRAPCWANATIPVTRIKPRVRSKFLVKRVALYSKIFALFHTKKVGKFTNK